MCKGGISGHNFLVPSLRRSQKSLWPVEFNEITVPYIFKYAMIFEVDHKIFQGDHKIVEVDHKIVEVKSQYHNTAIKYQ